MNEGVEKLAEWQKKELLDFERARAAGYNGGVDTYAEASVIRLLAFLSTLGAVWLAEEKWPEPIYQGLYSRPQLEAAGFRRIEEVSK